MRTVALSGLLACTLIVANSPASSAEALDLLQVNKTGIEIYQPSILTSFDAVLGEQIKPHRKQKKAEVKKHKVAKSDSLSTIAKQHDTTWKRLYAKNESIKHPDVITVGDELTIPRPDEKLKDRPLPEPIQEPVTPAIAPQPASTSHRPAARTERRTVRKPATTRPTVQARGSSTGNRYTAGYCTWYVKNRRPSLPNNLGNANTWAGRARAQGMATGSIPRTGAVGQRGMHVVYVERVNSNGTVTISEMNRRGLFVISTRTVPASDFTYIY